MPDNDSHLSPFHRFLGFRVVHAGSGRAELHLPYKDELLRVDGSDWIHGGVIASLIDIAANVAVASQVGHGVPTVDFRVDYLRPSRGSLTARATTLRAGRSLAVADVEIEDASGRVTAMGRALFALGTESAQNSEVKE